MTSWIYASLPLSIIIPQKVGSPFGRPTLVEHCEQSIVPHVLLHLFCLRAGGQHHLTHGGHC